MRRWVVGLGTLTCALAAGASWFVTTWEDVRVVDSADDAAKVAEEDPADRGTASTSGSSTTSMTIPGCNRSDTPGQGDPNAEWSTMVVDRSHALPATYAPGDLVSVRDAGFDASDHVRRIVIDDLRALREAAFAHGAPIQVISGYRSYERQAEVFADAVEREGAEAATASTAQAGHSEHQLGTAIDVLDTGSGELTPEFADSPAGRWLADNAHRYGFVLSYPDVPYERSCFQFEPWHLRYVGRDVATQIVESELTPREWMLTNG